MSLEALTYPGPFLQGCSVGRNASRGGADVRSCDREGIAEVDWFSRCRSASNAEAAFERVERPEASMRTSTVRVRHARGERVHWDSLDFSASSSLNVRRFALYFARSSSTLMLASTSLASMLFLRGLPAFRGVLPGSRRALEKSSFKLSRAMLDEVPTECGGSKSDSGSELEGSVMGGRED